jgi:HTH-type transcriptional regulator/antitoxin HipB
LPPYFFFHSNLYVIVYIKEKIYAIADKYMETIIKELCQARKKKGMTQSMLARSVGLPQSHISDIERGRIDLRLSTLIQITRVLNHEITMVPRQLDMYIKSIIEGREEVDTEPRFLPDQDEELVWSNL